MSEKPIAGFLTVIAVAPLCLVCAPGPASFVAAGAWLLAWLGGFGLPFVAALVGAVGGWLAWCAFQRRLERFPDDAGHHS